MGVGDPARRAQPRRAGKYPPAVAPGPTRQRPPWRQARHVDDASMQRSLSLAILSQPVRSAATALASAATAPRAVCPESNRRPRWAVPGAAAGFPRLHLLVRVLGMRTHFTCAGWPGAPRLFTFRFAPLRFFTPPPPPLRPPRHPHLLLPWPRLLTLLFSLLRSMCCCCCRWARGLVACSGARIAASSTS